MAPLATVIPLSPGLARRLVAGARFRIERFSRRVARAAERVRRAPPSVGPLAAIAASRPSFWSLLRRIRERLDDSFDILAFSSHCPAPSEHGIPPVPDRETKGTTKPHAVAHVLYVQGADPDRDRVVIRIGSVRTIVVVVPTRSGRRPSHAAGHDEGVAR